MVESGAARVLITYDIPTAKLTAPDVTGSGPYAFAFQTRQSEDTVGAAEVLTLTNDGSAPLVVSGIALSGANPSDYIVQNGCQEHVAVSGACEIDVGFAPQAIGASSATMTISSNSINGSDVVSLSGTGGPLPQGQRGAPGEVDLVTCKAVTKKVHGKKVTKQHCTTKLTSSPERLTTGVARATLLRADRVYAIGWLRNSRLLLHATEPLNAGRFRLRLTYATDGRTHYEHRTITID